MKKILVCGASGFIGRNIFEALSKKLDSKVYGTYFNSQVPENEDLDWIDLTNKKYVLEATRGMDVIIHAAAVTDGSAAVNLDPAGYIADNIRINTNIAEAAYKNKISHLIFMSCSVMYPHSSKPLKESEADLSKIHPRYFMGARLKVFAENLCKFYAGLGETRFTIIRHSNIYGPYDKYDLNKSHVFAASICKVISALNNEVVIWGSGKEKRDFMHISDLVKFVELVENKQSDSKFEIFNVGSGCLISVNELVEKIISLSKKDLRIKYDLSKPTIDINISLDINKARKIGWSPQINIHQGIKDAIQWYTANREEKERR